MTQASRLVRHRDGVPVYQYRADSHTPPVSVIRTDGIPEHRVHIHDFPVLWYAPTVGLVYVVAPGAAVDPGKVPHRENGVGFSSIRRHLTATDDRRGRRGAAIRCCSRSSMDSPAACCS